MHYTYNCQENFFISDFAYNIWPLRGSCKLTRLALSCLASGSCRGSLPIPAGGHAVLGTGKPLFRVTPPALL